MIFFLRNFSFADILSISDTRSYLTAKNIWGSLRGLETFSQMIYLNEDGAVRCHHTFNSIIIVVYNDNSLEVRVGKIAH